MYKILIADDEHDIRHGLSYYFPWHEIGFEVVNHVDDGLEAIEYISCHSIDVLLCDVMMPVMTGIEVARQLYTQKSPVQVVFLSAHKNFDFVQQALQYGVRNYMLKPTKYQELLDTFLTLRGELDERAITVSPITVSEPTNTPPPLLDGVTDPIVIKIIHYINDSYREATLEGASQIVHMNATYVSKYFKQKTDINFSDYLNRVRMCKAAELLEQHQLKTYEVSTAVGYNNSKNFTRSFKRHFGKSPRDFIQGFG